MPKSVALSPASPWVELSTTDADWKQADPALLGTLLSHLHLIRAFEETVLELAGEGLVHGPAHSSIGQEGGAAGSIVALGAADEVNGSHRGHHQFLAKALVYLMPDGIDPKAPVTPAIQDLLQRTLAEILGLAQGFCKGRGGSMHLQWAEAGALGTNAIVGGGVPLAAGAAWAHRHANTDTVAVTYFGDGAVNIGSVLETMNLAAAWKLPLCFFIENNLYAVSTTVEEATAEPRLSARGLGFNIPSWKVDGMDPLAVYLAMQQALAHMRAGNGPTVIEADVYRFFHQNGPFPAALSVTAARKKSKAGVPVIRWSGWPCEMKKRDLIDDAGLAGLRETIKQAMVQAAAQLLEADPDGKPGKRRIRPQLWPSPDFRDVGYPRRPQRVGRGPAPVSSRAISGGLEQRKFIDAIADVMNRRMETDDSIVVMGEDVHRLKGGTNGATRGLKERFAERTLGTPISENAFCGLGGGLALDGRFKPVVEFMYPDFMWVAADQVFNQIGKARHMFGGQSDVPLVLRTKIAMGTGYGSQHSMDPAGIYVTNPGWRIVAASTPFDYIGLMNTALACKDPVLVIEHVDLYSHSGEVPVDDLDYQIRIRDRRRAPRRP